MGGEDTEQQDPEVQFLLAEGNEQLEALLERVRGQIERSFQDGPTGSPAMMLFSPNAKQQVSKPVFTVDYATKTVKDLLHYSNTRDPAVQLQAITQLVSRWNPDTTEPAAREANESLVSQIKQEGGLRTLTNLAVDNKESTQKEVVACQAQLTKLFSLLTESSTVRDHIKQTGAVPSFLQMLASWSKEVSLKKELVINGLTTISNLCLDEAHATIVRKLGGIPTIVGLVTGKVDQEVNVAALRTLIMLSNTSVKNQEAIAAESLLEYLFQAIKTPTVPVLDREYLQLLLNLSTCAKTRAIAPPRAVLVLLGNLKITDVYPKVETYEIRKYYRNADIPFDGMENSEVSTRQASIIEVHRQAFAAEPNWTLLLFSYLVPVYNIPFDMFKWNFTLIQHVMKLAQNLILEDSMRATFIAKDGYTLMCKFLTLADVFPPNILLAAGEVISALGSRKGGAAINLGFGTEGIPPLLRLFAMFPFNDRLQLLVARTINSLSCEERNRLAVFQEGGLQALNTLSNIDNDEVASQACEAFANLSHDKFVRRAMRVMGTIIPTIVRLLSQPKVNIQKSCIIVLYNLTLEEEARDIVTDVKTGASPSILTPLIQSSETIIQASALKILAVAVKRVEYLHKFVELQGLPKVLEVLLVEEVDVQAGAMDLLANLALNGDCRETLNKLGLVDKLKAFAKHPNVARPNSELVEPMRNLILKLKSPPAANTSSNALFKTMFFQCTFNGEMKLLRVPSAVRLANFTKIVRENFGMAPGAMVSIQYPYSSFFSVCLTMGRYTGKLGIARINSDAELEALMLKLSPAETHQFLIFAADLERTMTPPSPISSEDASGKWRSAFRADTPLPPVPISPVPTRPLPPGVSQELFQLLGQLDEVQLRALVLELARQNPSMNVIDSVKQVLQDEALEVVTPNASSVPPPLNKIVSAPTLLQQTNTASPSFARPPPPPIAPPPQPVPPGASNGTPPPPAMFKLKRKAQPNKYTEAMQKEKGQPPSYNSVLKELSDAVTGKLKLKHVNMEEEKEKTRKARQSQNANSILREIQQVGQLREQNREKSGKKLLLDQSVVQAMQIWKNDLRRWNTELQTQVDRNSKLMLLLFKLAEMREDELSFEEAVQLTKSSAGKEISQENLVDFLLRAGFSVKKNRYQEYGKEVYVEEYKTVLRPAALPIRYLLRAILLSIPGGATV